MAERFERDGIRCQYSSIWDAEVEDNESGWTVTFTSPGTAFLIMGHCPDVDDPAELADALLDDLKSELQELDVLPAVDNIAGQPAVGYDLNFIQFDFTNTCRIRAIPAGSGSLFILAQCSDDELDTLGNDMKAHIASLETDD